MAKVLLGMNMSLDGFVQDKDSGVGKLYGDFEALVQSDLLQDSIRDTGAVIMGRNSYGRGNSDYTDYEYQVPIFVVTHHPPEQTVKGENDNLKFNFVTDGIESAVAQAKAAAGDKQVTIVGGANIAQQVINAGLADELEVGIAPVLFGEGLRFFDHLKAQQIELETLSMTSFAGVTYLRYRVIKG